MDRPTAHDLHNLQDHIRLLKLSFFQLVTLGVTMANDLAALDSKLAELKAHVITRQATDHATIDAQAKEIADLKAAAGAPVDTTAQVDEVQSIIDLVVPPAV